MKDLHSSAKVAWVSGLLALSATLATILYPAPDAAPSSKTWAIAGP